MIWSDPPYGVNYAGKTDWTDQHAAGSSRKAIANDSLEPVKLQKLFGRRPERCQRNMRSREQSCTLPFQAPLLKYFIQGFEDGGFAYRHCLAWVKKRLYWVAATITTVTSQYCVDGWKTVPIISAAIGPKLLFSRSIVPWSAIAIRRLSRLNSSHE